MAGTESGILLGHAVAGKSQRIAGKSLFGSPQIMNAAHGNGEGTVCGLTISKLK
jgi:hypothetical protein